MIEQINAYLRNRFANIHRTDPVDYQVVKSAVEQIYEQIGLPRPQVVMVSSPLVGTLAARYALCMLDRQRNPNSPTVTQQRLVWTGWPEDQVSRKAKELWQNREIDWLGSYRDEMLLRQSYVPQWPRGECFTAHSGDIERRVLETVVALTGVSVKPYCAKDTRTTQDWTHVDFCRLVQEGVERVLFKDDKPLKTFFHHSDYGYQSASSWMVQHQNNEIERWYIHNILKDQSFKHEPAWETLRRECPFFLMFKEFCVYSDRPQTVELNQRGLLDSRTGPALRWRDEVERYFVDGRNVERKLVMAPHTVTVSDICTEVNVERRRLMLSIFGETRFLTEMRADPIQQDKFGTLYRIAFTGDEPLVMVRVQNSTPEPDGSFKFYYLRVPPEMQTARQAVAWTFDVGPKEYKPERET